MYFNDEQNSTNIDKEFNNENNNKFNLNSVKNKYVLIGVIVVVIILLIGLFLLTSSVKKEFFLELNGLEDMTVYQNSTFVDPGYKAYDKDGNDYTEEVLVSGNVNTTVAGEYTITYSYNDIVKERIVTVLGDKNQVTYLNLIGSQVIYLKVGEEYKEPGYIVLDSVEEDLEKRVVTTGAVNTKVAGTYKIVYSVINSSGVTINAERTVIVMDSDINLSYSPTEVTNTEVTITVKAVSNYFDYILLPNGMKSMERETTYKTTVNGDYIFKVFDKNGDYKTAELTINNIDLEKPSGNCIATYSGTKTIINVTANDNIGVSSYNYIVNQKEIGYINNSKYEYSGNGTSVLVDVKDTAGNVNRITCSYKNNASAPSQKPSSSGTSSLYNMTVAQQPSTDYPCNLDVTNHNQKLANKVKQYGYKTRAGVVAAATYLTRDLGYKIGYWWAGKYDKVGLNSEWGCPRKEWDESNTSGPYAYGTVHPFGLDCTGFIKWAFINAGFDADLIPRGNMSYYYGDVMPKEVKFANAGNEINNIKPGDLLWKKGHYVVVIAVSDTQLKIAQSVYAGIREDLVDKKTGKQLTHDGQFESFVLLEEFFNKYGN